MAQYGYSAGYQGGGPQSVPSGYIEAYAQAGRNIGAGIQSAGNAIGESLQRYGQNKEENQFLTSRLESLAPYLQTVAQGGNIMDKNTPESKLLGDIEKFSSMNLAQKKATLLNAEFFLDRADKSRAREMQDVQTAAARQQLQLGQYQLEETLGKRDQQRMLSDAIRYGLGQPQSEMITDQISQPVSVQYNREGPFAPAPAPAPAPQAEDYSSLPRVKFVAEASADAANMVPQFRPLQPQFNVPPATSIPQTWESVLGADFANQLGTPVQPAPQRPATTIENQGMTTFETTKQVPVTSQRQIPYAQQSEKLTRYLVDQGAKPETIAMVPQIMAMLDRQKPTRVEQVGNLGSVVRFGDKEQFVPTLKADIGDMLKVKGLTIDFPEFRGTAPTEVEAVKFRDQYSIVLESRKTIADLLDIAKMGAVMQQTPEVRTRANSLATGLRGIERLNIIGPGTITPEDFKLLNSVIPDPTAIFSLKKSNIQAFETMLQKSTRAIESNAKGIGLEAIKPQKQPVTGASSGNFRLVPGKGIQPIE